MLRKWLLQIIGQKWVYLHLQTRIQRRPLWKLGLVYYIENGGWYIYIAIGLVSNFAKKEHLRCYKDWIKKTKYVHLLQNTDYIFLIAIYKNNNNIFKKNCEYFKDFGTEHVIIFHPSKSCSNTSADKRLNKCKKKILTFLFHCNPFFKPEIPLNNDCFNFF